MLDRTRMLDSLPDELIGEIMACMLSGDDSPFPGLRFTAVSPRWRHIAHNTPALWTRILVCHDKDPSILQDIINHSQSLALDVEFRLPAFRYRFDTTYTQHLEILVHEIHRWRSFTVFATNPVLHLIRKHIQGLSMPLLQRLHLVQTGDGQLHHLGPFVLEPAVFRCLQLERVMIYVEDSRMLGGLQHIRLVESSMAILDENKLLSFQHPAATTEPRLPSMTSLQSIHLDASSPTPDGLPYSSSFSPAHITTVFLSRLVAPSFDIVQALSRFYGTVLSSSALKSITIANIHGHALAMLLTVIRNVSFPPLQYLSFREIDTAEIEDRVISAFAAGVEELVLENLDAEPFTSQPKMAVKVRINGVHSM